jgi:hypothetical protein
MNWSPSSAAAPARRRGRKDVISGSASSTPASCPSDSFPHRFTAPGTDPAMPSTSAASPGPPVSTTRAPSDDARRASSANRSRSCGSFDVDSSSVASWNAKLLANLSSDISSGEKRKILFPPAIVKQNSPFRFDAVYVGTGDREHPLCLTANQTSPTVLTNSCSQFVPSDKIFMVIDPDYGLTASNSAPVVVSDLYQRLASDLTTNTSNTILNTNKGWYRNYDNGEKSANAPTVLNQRLRFGTYAPLGQSGGACVPAGEGRLNEIDALTGDFVPINGTVTSAADRYYATFITHGYISTGQLVVQGKNIYHIVVSDSRLQSVLVGTLGSATKIYWYMEPEQ